MMQLRAPVVSRLAAFALFVGIGSAPLSSEAGPEPRRSDNAGFVGATVQGEQYEIKLEAGALKVGEPGSIVVSISPKAGFKFNQEFPTKLTVDAPPDGLTFPEPTLKKADGTLDAKGVFTFRMPVTASRAGEYDVQTKLKFSVCTAEKCVVQRQVLSAKLTAQ